jgi:hypothetical protein
MSSRDEEKGRIKMKSTAS